MNSVYNLMSSNREAGEFCVSKDHAIASDMSDSFVVDMEHFPHLHVQKDITGNSRIKRNLSRKGFAGGRGGDNIISHIITAGDGDATPTASPRATLHGSSTPEKPMVTVSPGAHDQSIVPQIHHQITITNGSVAPAETKLSGGRRYSFRRSRGESWAIDPRRILLFFATLSIIGTILLIYLTLSMNKLSEDGTSLEE